MAWFKVDDGFYTSLKFLSIKREQQAQAAGLWLLAGTWSADKMTDGFVPWPVLNMWIYDEATVGQLIGVGLWLQDDDRGGIQFHDWCDYQPTRESLEAKAVSRSEKNRANVAKRWDKTKSDTTEIQTAYKSDTNEIQNYTPEPEPEPEPFTSYEVNTYGHSAFEEFWNLVPRKVQKATAQRAFIKASKQHGSEVILDGIKRLASDPNLPETRFIPHPATWLNAEGWLDDPYPAKNSASAKQQQQQQAAEKFLANFNQQPELTANPDWA